MLAPRILQEELLEIISVSNMEYYIKGNMSHPPSLMESLRRTPLLAPLQPSIPQETVAPVRANVSRPFASSSLVQQNYFDPLGSKRTAIKMNSCRPSRTCKQTYSISSASNGCCFCDVINVDVHCQNMVWTGPYLCSRNVLYRCNQALPRYNVDALIINALITYILRNFLTLPINYFLNT